MSTREERWPEGVPAWVELRVPDRQVARRFYGQLFDWDFEEAGPGSRTTALRGGRRAAAFGILPEDASEPPQWMTFLATDDIEGAVERCVAHGGRVIEEIAAIDDRGDQATVAVLADPTGAVFGLWEAGLHTGAHVVNEPGAVVWNELMTHDVATAREFYSRLFEYAFGDMSGPDFIYHTMEIGGHIAGGLGAIPAELVDDVPTSWTTYFAVADTDAAVEVATALGGVVTSPAADSAYGRMAVIRGPFGESFAVMSTEEEPTPPLTS